MPRYPCRGAAKSYGIKLLSGDMARIRDIPPVICRGFVIFQVRHAKRPQGERRAPLAQLHLDIQASVDLEGLKQIQTVLQKYAEILEMMVPEKDEAAN